VVWCWVGVVWRTGGGGGGSGGLVWVLGRDVVVNGDFGDFVSKRAIGTGRSLSGGVGQVGEERRVILQKPRFALGHKLIAKVAKLGGQRTL